MESWRTELEESQFGFISHLTPSTRTRFFWSTGEEVEKDLEAAQREGTGNFWTRDRAIVIVWKYIIHDSLSDFQNV